MNVKINEQCTDKCITPYLNNEMKQIQIQTNNTNYQSLKQHNQTEQTNKQTENKHTNQTIDRTHMLHLLHKFHNGQADKQIPINRNNQNKPTQKNIWARC